MTSKSHRPRLNPVAGTVSSLALLLLTSAVASAQTPTRKLNLQVRNVDLGDSCQGPSFRPEIKIINWSSSPAVLTQSVVRIFFNNDRADPIEFVNADFVRIFNADGTLTGTFATAFHFEGPPPSPACVATPARIANQRHFIAFQPITPDLVTIPANGGSATVVVAFRRNGGQSPFDAGCDDYTKLVSQNPSRPFQEDAFYNLVEAGGQGAPSTLICEFTSPTATDPLTGRDPCSNSTGCSP